MASEVSENIDQLLKELGSKYIMKSMQKACAIVRNAAIEKAPHKTGNLERSIDFKVADDGLQGVVFSNAEYAPYVEVGTGIYSTKGDGRDTPWRYKYYDKGQSQWCTTKGSKAQPFLEPALQENTSKIRECFEGMF